MVGLKFTCNKNSTRQNLLYVSSILGMFQMNTEQSKKIRTSCRDFLVTSAAACSFLSGQGGCCNVFPRQNFLICFHKLYKCSCVSGQHVGKLTKWQS